MLEGLAAYPPVETDGADARGAVDAEPLRVRLSSNAAQLPGGEIGTVVATGFVVLVGLAGLALVLVQGRNILGALPSLLLTVVMAVVAVVHALRSLRQPVVTIGADGIALRAGSRVRFFPFRRVAGVELDPRGLRLSIHGEPRQVHLRTWRHGLPLLPVSPSLPRVRCVGPLHQAALDEQRALFARARAALRVADRAEGSEPLLERLERRGRLVDVWRSDLRAQVVAGNEYRRTGLSRDELSRVLLDAYSAPERRIGAALALAPEPEGELAQAALRAAGACANEALRPALEEALAGELDAETLERAAVWRA